jgi:hypothetical protein
LRHHDVRVVGAALLVPVRHQLGRQFGRHHRLILLRRFLLQEA